MVEAISDSSEINDGLRDLQQAGYSLYLVVDCKSTRKPKASRAEQVKKAVADAEARCERPPVFRIDGKDLLFLRSIGIDPTRRSRSRRPSSESSESSES